MGGTRGYCLEYTGYKLLDMRRCEGNGFQTVLSLEQGIFFIRNQGVLAILVALVAYESFDCTLNTHSLLCTLNLHQSNICK